MGSSNVEMRYRDAEMARILNSDRVNRILKQEMTVSRMRQRDQMHVLMKHWLMVGPCNGLTQDEIAAVSLDDIKKRDELALEQNAQNVAKNQRKNQSRVRSSWRLHAIISDPT